MIVFQTFEAKIHHLETRPCRKPKDSLEGLEYFVRCEVHLSDVSTLISSIKRNAEDVKTTKEVKCNALHCFYKTHLKHIQYFAEIITKATAFFPLFTTSSLVPKENSRLGQMSSSGHKI